jgi:hypothetical protein
MIALYENFPEESIHEKENFAFTLSNKKLQQKLIQVLKNINCRTFTFEDVGNPTVPGCTLIFEVGIADSNSFTFIDEDEAKRVLAVLKNEGFRVMDFFCAIRYYKDYTSNKKPLRFDYYMVRFLFAERNWLEMQVFHERGPRYVSPKDLTAFLLKKVNETSAGGILKQIKRS